MIKKIAFLFILTFLICQANAQNKSSLYLIQAHTFDDLGGMFQFYNYLYKLNDYSLDTIFELSSEKEFLYSVKFYPEYNKIIFYKDGWKYNSEKHLGVINTKTIELKTDYIDYVKYYIMGGVMAEQNNESAFVLDLFGRKEQPKNVFLAINLSDFSQKVVKPEIYCSVKLVGAPGGVMTGEDYLMVYTSKENGKLFIPQTHRIEERPVFPLEIPDSLQLKEKKRILILINNKKSFVVAINESEPNVKDIGYSKLVIRNKISEQWFSYLIKGNRQVMRGFGSWLAGTVVSDNMKLITNENGAVTGKEIFDRVSPGKSERRKKAASTGTTFDKRADYYNLYYSGILYLLNVDTRIYMEWNTGQGDSEILLVQDEVVYYRVNDKIFKVPIINGEKLGESELLIQDERVPDIHWAFIGDK
jgi:hypothetical protein